VLEQNPGVDWRNLLAQTSLDPEDLTAGDVEDVSDELTSLTL
jgi:hypothetical protein